MRGEGGREKWRWKGQGGVKGRRYLDGTNRVNVSNYHYSYFTSRLELLQEANLFLALAYFSCLLASLVIFKTTASCDFDTRRKYNGEEGGLSSEHWGELGAQQY